MTTLPQQQLPSDLERWAKPAAKGNGVWWTIGVSAILFIAACISGLAAVTAFGTAKTVMHEILACLLMMNALGCLCGVAVVELLRNRP